MISVANTPSSIRHLAPRECNEIVSRCLSCSCKITVKVSLCMCKYFLLLLARSVVFVYSFRCRNLIHLINNHDDVDGESSQLESRWNVTSPPYYDIIIVVVMYLPFFVVFLHRNSSSTLCWNWIRSGWDGSGQIMPSEDIKLPFSTVKDPREFWIYVYIVTSAVRGEERKLSRWKNEIRRDWVCHHSERGVWSRGALLWWYSKASSFPTVRYVVVIAVKQAGLSFSI